MDGLMPPREPWKSERSYAGSMRYINMVASVTLIFLFSVIVLACYLTSSYQFFLEPKTVIILIAMTFFGIPMMILSQRELARKYPKGTESWRLQLPFNRKLYLKVESELATYLENEGYTVSAEEEYGDVGRTLWRKASDRKDGKMRYGRSIVIDYSGLGDLLVEFNLVGLRFPLAIRHIRESNQSHARKLADDILEFVEKKQYRLYPSLQSL